MNPILATKDGYHIRLAQTEDAIPYYEQNYCPLDQEVSRFTGCKPSFRKDEMLTFFESSLKDQQRYFFLVIDSNDRIVGESVINGIDWDVRSANFRIAIFQKSARGKGVGSWVTAWMRDYAFETLKLHRLSLDVFSFNF